MESKTRLIFLAIIAVILTIGAMVIYSIAKQPVHADEAGVQCPMDVRLCPGGVYVGRVGPHCEFPACP